MLKTMIAKRNQKGFTLMEMLIVVAIIAILVAIAIPVLSSQLEKAREATDAANIRAAYAEAMVAYIDGTGTASATSVDMVQRDSGWKYIKGEIAGVKMADVPSVTKGDKVTVTVGADGAVSMSKGTATTGSNNG